MFDLHTAIKEAVSRAEQPEEAKVSSSRLTPPQVRAEQGKRLTASVPQGEPLDEAASNRLAEGYALQGEFEQAVKFATGRRLAEYEKIYLAVLRNDSAWCACPERIGTGTRAVKTKFEKDRFLRRGREVSLMACAVCGFMNCV